MRDACGLDCRGDGVGAAVVVHAHVARTEVRRKEDVDALRAAEGTLERGPLVDIGDSDIRTRFAPRLPLGGVVQHDTDLLLLRSNVSATTLPVFPEAPSTTNIASLLRIAPWPPCDLTILVAGLVL